MRVVVLLALVAACTSGPDGAPDAGRAPDAGVVVDGGTLSLKPCMDRPNELPRPPGSRLPCELLPPDFGPVK